MHPEALDLLTCPCCAGAIAYEMAPEHGQALLKCVACGKTAAINGGIPRFIDTPRDEHAKRTQASFGYEWSHFNDWRESGEVNFKDYFAGFDLASLRDKFVLDAGCGMGRHARQVARFAKHVIAVDFSSAIDQAARNTAGLDNVTCIQSDLLALPFPNDRFDFVYSLGVLHHLVDTEGALSRLIDKLRPGGKIRIYVYWKRHGWRGWLLRSVILARRITTKLPFALLRGICWLISVFLYGAVIIPYRLLMRLGVPIREDWPLFVYSKYPFRVLYNDQFDRFSAPIEKRYDANEVLCLLESAGLQDVRVRASFGWIADGTKPS